MFCGCSQDNILSQAKGIKVIKRYPSKDLAICQVVDHSSQYLSVIEEKNKIGTSVCTGGFPASQLLINSKGGSFGLNLKKVKQYWHPSTITGLERNMNLKMGKKYDAIVMNQFGIKGLSGGPIFNIAGDVVGLFTSAISIGSSPSQSTKSYLYVLNNSVGVSADEINKAISSFVSLAVS